MEQDGGPGFLQQVLLLIATVAVCYGAAVLILSLEQISPFAAPQAGSSSLPSGRPAAAALSHPLPCDVRIADGMTSVTLSRERCYMTKATKEAK